MDKVFCFFFSKKKCYPFPPCQESPIVSTISPQGAVIARASLSGLVESSFPMFLQVDKK